MSMFSNPSVPEVNLNGLNVAQPNVVIETIKVENLMSQDDEFSEVYQDEQEVELNNETVTHLNTVHLESPFGCLVTLNENKFEYVKENGVSLLRNFCLCFSISGI